MADIKWSAFPSGGTILSTDTLVGLRAGANYKFTAIAPAEVQQAAFNYQTAGGMNDAFTVTLSPAPAAYTDGLLVVMNSGAFQNLTTTPTLNVNGLGAKDIVWSHGALAAGDIITNTTYILLYNAGSTQFELINPTVSIADTFAVQTNAYNVAVDAGVANAYVVTLSPAPPSLVNALTVYMLVAHANSGASTITVNGTTKSIVNSANTALSANELVVGQMAVLVYSSNYDKFILVNPSASFIPSAGSAGTILRSNGTNWVATTSTFADTYSASTLLYSNGANTVTGLATANSAVLVTNSTGVPAWSGTMTNGQVIIGATSGTPTAATLTAGTGVTITNGSGSITVASSGASPWVDQTTNSVTMAANTGYTSDAGASLVTFTLPITSAIGDWIEINGKGSGLWTIAQAAGQQIFASPNNTTLGAGGSLSSVNQYDNVRLRCITANTIWTVVSQQDTGLTIV